MASIDDIDMSKFLLYEVRLPEKKKNLHYHGLVEDIIQEGKNADRNERNTGYTKRRRLAIVGPAGSGKSHMIRTVERDLSASKENEDIVAIQNFRDLSPDIVTTPWQFLFGDLAGSDDSNSQGFKWVVENQHNLILLWDGLDQARWRLREDAEVVQPYGQGRSSDIVSSIFSGKLLPGVRVIYTSRQSTVAEIPPAQRPDDVITLTGLSGKHSEHVFKNLLGDEKGIECWAKLQDHPLLPMLHFPMYLILAAILSVLSGEVPNYFTSVMLKLFEYFKQSGLKKERDVPALMKKLRKMAYQGMLRRSGVFAIEDLTACELTFEDLDEWIVDVPGYKKLTQILMAPDPLRKPQHHFTQYLFQEILSAEHIITLPLDDFKKTLENDLDDNLWIMVITFLSGLLLNEEVQISDDIGEVSDLEAKKEILRKMMVKKWIEADHPTVTISMLGAIAESNDGDYIREYMDEIRISTYPVGLNGAYAIARIVEHHSGMSSLCLPRGSIAPPIADLMWGALRSNGVQLKHLDMSEHEISAESMAMAGCVLQHESVLELPKVHIASQGLQAFRIAFGAKKLKRLEMNLYQIFHPKEGKMIGSMMMDQGTLSVAYCCLNATTFRGIQEGLGQRKLKKLDISGNRVDDEVLIRMVPTMIADDAILEMRDAGLTSYRLWRFMNAMAPRKISELELSNNTLDKDGYAVLGELAKQCSVGKLFLIKCRLNATALEMLSKVDGVKTPKLDISLNPLNEKMINALGRLVKRWSLASLEMQSCELTEPLFNLMIDRFKGAKLSYMDVSENGLSDAQLRRISDELKVEKVFCLPPYDEMMK